MPLIMSQGLEINHKMPICPMIHVRVAKPMNRLMDRLTGLVRLAVWQ